MTVINDLREQISALQSKINEIQNECSHPKSCVTKKYHEATDEYGTTVTNKWNTFSCSLCEHRWTEEIPLKD